MLGTFTNRTSQNAIDTQTFACSNSAESSNGFALWYWVQ